MITDQRVITSEDADLCRAFCQIVLFRWHESLRRLVLWFQKSAKKCGFFAVAHPLLDIDGLAENIPQKRIHLVCVFTLCNGAKFIDLFNLPVLISELCIIETAA